MHTSFCERKFIIGNNYDDKSLVYLNTLTIFGNRSSIVNRNLRVPHSS